MDNQTVFVSFLGTNQYLECNYCQDESKRCDNVRFIQTAVRKLFCPEAEKALIFVTPGAREKNLGGLQQECRSNGLSGMEAVDIPNGQDEEELWEIFRIVGKNIPERGELIFDITHSFRSLPLLMSLLLNYLRTVKKVQLAGCYYGAFEKLGRKEDVEKMDMKERNAPIFDLTPFFALNDWTDAISRFEDYGRSEDLLKLTKRDRALLDILRKSQGQDQNAATLRNVVKAVDDFSTLAHTANCGKLYEMDVRQRIAEPLEKLAESADADLLPQLRPVLDKVRTMFAGYENRSLKNGLRAAAWCAEHNLIPQGFTMLQETVISLEVERWREQLDKLMPDKLEQRKFISGVLDSTATKKDPTRNFEYSEAEMRLISELQANWSTCREFLGHYDSITKFRNQLNHGGTGNNDFRSANMREKLETLTREMLVHYGMAKGDGQTDFHAPSFPTD